jgi:hypothetical protein
MNLDEIFWWTLDVDPEAVKVALENEGYHVAHFVNRKPILVDEKVDMKKVREIGQQVKFGNYSRESVTEPKTKPRRKRK